MSKPYIHAEHDVKKWGGLVSDYIEIHNLMDSSKAVIADNRHRALTHTSWFLVNILERIKFHNSEPESPGGKFLSIRNSDGKVVQVRDIGEAHILEDFGHRYIPSAQDYLSHMTFEPWMNNGINGAPASAGQVIESRKKTIKLAKPVMPEEPMDSPFDDGSTQQPPMRILDIPEPMRPTRGDSVPTYD